MARPLKLTPELVDAVCSQFADNNLDACIDIPRMREIAKVLDSSTRFEAMKRGWLAVTCSLAEDETPQGKASTEAFFGGAVAVCVAAGWLAHEAALDNVILEALTGGEFEQLQADVESTQQPRVGGTEDGYPGDEHRPPAASPDATREGNG